MNKDQRMLEEAFEKVMKGINKTPKNQDKQNLPKTKDQESNDGVETPEEQKVASELNKNPQQGLSDEEFEDVIKLLDKKG
jgi:Ca2+-binding EF-hand superfamily protein